MTILEFQHITKTYRKQSALDSFDLQLDAGKALGLLGLNGAGKSTLINITAGLIGRTSGRLFALGNEIRNDSYLYKRRIGFVLERPLWFDKLTVKEYLVFVGTMFGLHDRDAVARCLELIDYFDLTEHQDARIESYSSGMKKKVSLAAALIHHPLLLVLDEPFEGMDPPALRKTTQLLHELKSNGVSIMIASHRLDSIEQLCDEVAIIDKGRNIFRSSVEQIFHSHPHNETENTIHSLEDLFLSVLNISVASPDSVAWDARRPI